MQLKRGQPPGTSCGGFSFHSPQACLPALNAVRLLQFSDVLDNGGNVVVVHLRLCRHVAEAPVMLDGTEHGSAVKCAVGMLIGTINLVYE